MIDWRSKNTNNIKNKSKSWRENNKDYDKQRKQEWYQKNKERVKIQGEMWRENNKPQTTNRHLQKTYGITLTQYNELLKKQNECCAICSRPSKELKKRLGVDHNHMNGKIRGLLCHECNCGLGYFKDTSSLLLQAASYLDKCL